MSKSIAGFVVAGVLIAGLVWVFAPRDQGPDPLAPDTEIPIPVFDADGPLVDFPPFLLPVEDLRATWEAERAALGSIDDASRSLIDSGRRVNFAQGLMARSLFEGDFDALRDAHNAERRAWAEFKTGEDFLALGWTAHDAFEDALREVLRLASTTDTALDDLLRNPLDPTIHAYYEACGDFLDHAMRFELVGPNGQVWVQPEFYTLLFRRMWVNHMRDHWMPDAVLPGLESREFLRWQLEHGEVALAARLNLIEEFEEEHGFTEYPVSFARAVAHVLADDNSGAREILDAAVESGETHPLILDAVERLAGADGSRGE